jgi:hypothetical protein
MSAAAVCPCELLIHPADISNPPCRAAIAYRVGDFITFRHALLLSLPGETELSNWKPNASGDLAVQLIEWWAYIADIITFYNERSANNQYLRTAELPEDLNRLIRLLGYRPRPGIGAVGEVSALLTASTPITIPAGFAIQSKPGPGKTPQTFEVSTDTLVQPPDALDVDPPADPALIKNGGVLLKGTVSAAKKGDNLLLVRNDLSQFAIVTVSGDPVSEKDPRGVKNTRVPLSGLPSFATGAKFSDCRLLKSGRFARPWQYNTGNTAVITDQEIRLDSVQRSIQTGDLLYFEASPLPFVEVAIISPGPVLPVLAAHPALSPRAAVSGGGLGGAVVAIGHRPPVPQPVLATVTRYTEEIWYANPDSTTGFDPNKPPAQPTPPISILHSVLDFSPSIDGATYDFYRSTTLVRFAWTDVGELIGTPVTTFNGQPPRLNLASSSAPAAATLPKQPNYNVQIEDANGIGESATVAGPPAFSVTGLPSIPPVLAAPLRLLFNSVPVSRGKTVLNEVLGSGDATALNQEFVLENSPLTYLQSTESTSGALYKSTLRVWVDGLEWQEAPSFYGQPPDARIFVTREDDQQKTHVQFGDGVNGARLSSGTNNVVANYRFGSGADAPPAGTLTVIAQPLPGLKSIRNPVAVGGGSDPDPPSQIRRYAPRSVLTFGRAVSRDDYEAIAAQAPGVTSARAYFSFDAPSQRSRVQIYVSQNQAALDSATTALNAATDPNRPFTVSLASPVPVSLTMGIVIDPARKAADVLSGVTSALTDPDQGLFGVNVIGIGQSIFESQIFQACLAVPGVIACHSLLFSTDPANTGNFQPQTGFRFDPGQGSFFQLLPANLNLSSEAPDNAG